jgi:two-component system sensor histidine kinase KdpD
MSIDDRPSPEALLAQVRKEGRGKLKIFLGAAPGVGKT